MKDKATLRAELRQNRDNLAPSEVAEKSARIVERVKSELKNRSFTTVHCYEPFASQHEVDIQPLIKMWQSLPGIQLYAPRLIKGLWREVEFGTGQLAADSVGYDLVLVPMLGFDKRLHRIGNGGGYYDRLLAKQPEAYKLGVCFESGRLGNIPAEMHDVSLDAIITEVHMH